MFLVHFLCHYTFDPGVCLYAKRQPEKALPYLEKKYGHSRGMCKYGLPVIGNRNSVRPDCKRAMATLSPKQ